MKTQSSSHSTRRPFLSTWARVLLIIAFALPQAFAVAAPAAEAADYAWTAYNDVSGTSTPANTTEFTIGTTNGALLDFDTGGSTGATVTVTTSGTLTNQASSGAATASGTDAYNTFNGKVTMTGVVQYYVSSPADFWMDLTFNGLDPAKTYTFVTTANRNGTSTTTTPAYNTRMTRYTISGIDSATNASTAGTSLYNDDPYAVYFCTGYNTTNGYVARWTNIQPGSDGSFKVRAQPNDSVIETYAYGMFMLAEELPTGPTITTSVSTLPAFSAPIGEYSAEQSYTVTGSNLTEGITVSSPPDFEVSTVGGGNGFASTASLGATGGTVYVRFKRGTAGTSNENITHTSAGATQKDVAVSGAAGDPTITVTSSMTAFSSVVAVDSVEQTYTVAGSYLKGDITVTAPGDFLISKTTGTGYASSLTFFPTGGTLATTTVYVKFNRATVGTSTGDITHASLDAIPKNVEVSGTASLCGTVSLVTSGDTRMRASQSSTNYGSETTVTMSPYSTSAQGGLFKWGVSSIPSDATVSAASLSFYVTESSARVFSLYDLRRAWGESTATWARYDGTNAWGTSGAANTTSDRYNTNLWGATASTFGTAGNVTIDLNESGKAVVQDWIDGDLPNYGLTVQNYSGADQDYWIVASKENTSGYTKPTLNVTYCVAPTGPTITTSGTLTPFSTTPGNPSTPQTYTVSGSNLEDDILITAPTGFELSTDDITYSGSLTLVETDGVVDETDIYVRLKSSATEGSFSGDITHTSTNAETKNVAVGGAVLYIYTLTADDDDHGTVTLSPTGGSYNSGTTVTLIPVPASGYKFSDWSGDNALEIANTGGVYTILVNGNKYVKANFTLIPQYTLTTAVTPSDAGSVTLNPSGGTYDENTVVTVTAVAASGFAFKNWAGAANGTTNPTTVTMTGDKVVEAVFEPAQSCTTVNLVAVEDTYMSGVNTTNNYGASTTLKTTFSTNTKRGSLLKWSVSSIPSNATVDSASLTIQVTVAAAATYNLYSMTQDWVEGTGTGTVSNDGPTWLTYNGTDTWEADGAAGTTLDRDDTNLWGAGTTSFSSQGVKTVDLNTDGKAVLQGWIDGTIVNNGVTMQNYGTSTTTYDLNYYSSESTTGTKPTLKITYCIPAAYYTLAVANDGNGTVTIDPLNDTYTHGAVVTLTPVPASGYTFAYWSGDDAEDPSDNGDGTWSLVMDSNKSITANFSLLPVNVPPNQPVLVQPADDATGVATPPALRVTVSDDNAGDTLDVNFYGRAAGTTAAEDFTLVVIPDTQNEAQYYPTVMNNQIKWIADNKTAQTIVFATSVGDIVNTASSTTQWSNAVAAYEHLETGNVAYSVGPGNHDTGGLYSNYFGSARFAGKTWYQGYYTSGLDNYNNYSFFSAGGMDFILINLQFGSTSAMQTWADGLLKANPNKRGIVVQHNILNTDNSWNDQALYTGLKDNPNLFLMLCGHMHTSSDGSAYRAEPGDDGHTIHILMTDYQDYPNGGNGYLRLLRFSPANDKVYSQVYSPTLPEYRTSSSNYEQFEMAYDMPSGTAGIYTLIGTAEDVANGANASITWNGLANDTEYEWYAVVSDGALSTIGSTWSFTTGSGAVNTAPVLDPIGAKNVNELVQLAFTASATDDGLPTNTLTFSLDNGTSGTVPEGAGITTGGAFTWTPTEAQGPGSYTFDVCVSDGALSDCETITVSVAEVNVAPELAAIGARNVDELAQLAFIATATDADLPANTLAFSLAGTVPSGASIDSTSGAFTWTPTEAQGEGSYTFDVCVSDGALSDCETITVSVNEANVAPVLDAIGTKSVQELEELAFTATATDADLPANTLAFSLAGTVPSGASIDSTSGAFTWTPTEAQGPGTYTFDVCVSDGALSDCETITVSVTEGTTPVLPSSFFGEIHFMDGDGGPGAGGSIDAYVDGEATPIVNALITTNEGNLAYAINVPAYLDGDEPTSVTFKISDRIVATANWVSGTNVELDIHPPKADTGGAYVVLLDAATVHLSGSATDWGNDVFAYAWDLDDDGAYDDSTVASPDFAFSAVGTYPIRLKVTDSQDGEGYAASNVFVLTLAGLADQVYNNNPHPVTVAGVEDPFTVEVLYGTPGATTPPTDAGSYAVLVQIKSGEEVIGTLTSQLVIAKATATVTLDGLSHTYDDTTKQATATTVPEGLTVTFTYNGGTALPVSAGSYTVVATIEDTNYQGTASGTLVIAKATATVTLGSLNQTYDGEQKQATATTEPEGLTVTFTYDGSSTPPTAAGSYAVVATVVNGNYTGTASDTLVIAKATATVTLGSLSHTYDGTPKAATATTVPADLTVTFTYDGSETPPSAAGNYAVVATVVDDNYQGTADGTLVITALTHRIDLVVGWNLVSFNLKPADTGIAAVLSSLGDNYDLVYAWDATGASSSSGNWLKYDPAAPFGNTLTTLEDRQGFWIHMTAADTLEVSGSYEASTEISLSDNAGGWNLVGFPSSGSVALPGALDDHGPAGKYSLVITYHAVDAVDPWKLYDPAAPAYANDLAQMAPGWGYWIKVTDDPTWTVAY